MRRGRLVVVGRCVVDETQLKPRSAASRAVLSMQALVVTPMITRLEMPPYGRYGSKSELLKALQVRLRITTSRAFGAISRRISYAGLPDQKMPGTPARVSKSSSQLRNRGAKSR